jgi:hypothetical protein
MQSIGGAQVLYVVWDHQRQVSSEISITTYDIS